jgi:hypothetical protein
MGQTVLHRAHMVQTHAHGLFFTSSSIPEKQHAQEFSGIHAELLRSRASAGAGAAGKAQIKIGDVMYFAIGTGQQSGIPSWNYRKLAASR